MSRRSHRRTMRTGTGQSGRGQTLGYSQQIDQPVSRMDTLATNFRRLYSRLFPRSGSYTLPRIEEEVEVEEEKEPKGFEASRVASDDWEQQFDSWNAFSAEKKLTKDHLKFLKSKGFAIGRKLERGGYGVVFRATHTDDEGKKVDMACKVVSIGRYKDETIRTAVNEMLHESDICGQLNHENVVRRIDLIHLFDRSTDFPHPIHMLVFMELMDGDLSDLIADSKYGHLNEEQTHCWFKQVVSGLKYLHEHRICHLDIKPNNILYKKVKVRGPQGKREKHKVYKLTDFGFSRKLEDNQRMEVETIIGTIGYRAPEAVPSRRIAGFPADIYSLGVTVAQSLVGYEMQFIAFRKLLSRWDEDLALEYGVSEMLAELIVYMTEYYPDDRPTVWDLESSRWLTQSYAQYSDPYCGITRL